MQTAQDRNTAVLCGVVECDPVYDHAVYGESFYTFRLAVPRLSGVTDILPVTLPGRMPYLPNRGEQVCVCGQLRSYKKQYEGGNRLLLTVFARTLEPGGEPENHIELTGYLCKPAIFRTTPFMREITDLLIAVNRSYSKSDYLPCIAWGKNARAAQAIPVGAPVRAEGRLQSRAYTKTLESGESIVRIAYEVSCAAIEEY